MAKARTTLTIDEDILRSARIAAAHRGVKEGELIEDALRRYLGHEVFERIWERTGAEGLPVTDDGPPIDTMTHDQLLAWAVDLQHQARRDWREGAGGPPAASGD